MTHTPDPTCPICNGNGVEDPAGFAMIPCKRCAPEAVNEPQPASQDNETMSKRPFDTLPLPQQAGIICNDPRFQRFAAIRSGFLDDRLTTEGAAEYLRTVCKINSRRELATDKIAQIRFQAMRTDFDAWAGKIPNQR
jgi:hypothetical protein